MEHRSKGAKPWDIRGGGLRIWDEWTVPTAKDDKTTQRDLDVVELWSGAGHIAGAARESGHVAAEFDIERIPGHTNVVGPTSEDITTKGGFRKALRLVLRLRAGGLLWMAPLCSSFVFPNSGKCKRNASNFGGDTSYLPVEQGNYMAMVAMFFALVALCRDVHIAFVREYTDFLATLPTHIVDRCAFSDEPCPKIHKRYKVSASGPWIRRIQGACVCTGPRQNLMFDAPAGRTGNAQLLKVSGMYPTRLAETIIGLFQTFGPVPGPVVACAKAATWSTSQRSTGAQVDRDATKDMGDKLMAKGKGASKRVKPTGPWAHTGEEEEEDEQDEEEKITRTRADIFMKKQKVMIAGPWADVEEQNHVDTPAEDEKAATNKNIKNKSANQGKAPLPLTGPWADLGESTRTSTRRAGLAGPWADVGV